jgi:hypothetical protein
MRMRMWRGLRAAGRGIQRILSVSLPMGAIHGLRTR